MKTISKKTINTLREVPFKKQIVNYKNNANDWNPMPKEEVRYVTCHNTGGRGYSESYATNVANECNKGNAAPTYHFVVDHTKVIQLLPLNINGWHAGDNMGPGNMNSIGIEICQHYDGNIDTAMGKIEYYQSFKFGEYVAFKLMATLIRHNLLSISDVSRVKHN